MIKYRRMNEDANQSMTREVRRVSEDANRNYELIPSIKAKNLDSTLYDIIAYDYNLEIIPKSDDFPMPWDADFEIVGKNFVLTGHAGPSGFGKSTTIIPVNSVSKHIEFGLYGDIKQETIDQLKEYGWIVK